ncbi:MAG: hypothetical protein ACE5D2_04400 [Fidelibacterota bacterium]
MWIIELIKPETNRTGANHRAYAPFKSLLVEELPNGITAWRREKYYKTGFGKKVWMKKVKEGSGYS